MYEKIDKELLEFVEDVLLNRCENATERLLEFASTLEAKSKPCKVIRKGGAPVLVLSDKVCYLPKNYLVAVNNRVGTCVSVAVT